MITRIFCTVLGASLLLSVSVGTAQEFPKRRPGLWESTTSMPGLPGGAQKISECVDEATDAAMQQRADAPTSKNLVCSKREYSRQGEAFVAHNSCTAAGIVMESRAVCTGDYSARYNCQITVKYQPALTGRSEINSSLAATYQGACLSDQKPGDVILEDGKRFNVLEVK